jgi:molybdenum cofactor synthesis domain-containing protein
MRKIPVSEAVGHVLCHDITRIIPGREKGVAFRKGHVIRAVDVPELQKLGKDHIYVWEAGPGLLHEDEAADILRRLTQGPHMRASEPREGKIELTAKISGLLKIDRPRLHALNSLGELIIATRHGDFPVQAGDKLAGMRVIPLVIESEKLRLAEQLAGPEPLLQLLPLRAKKAAVIATGNEVYHRRIADAFTPVMLDKLAEYGCQPIFTASSPDESAHTAALIRQALDKGAELILCCGGMSVDPDDLTPAAIRQSGAQVVSYGAPVLPGAMLMLAYHGKTPIVGLPGCAMYNKRTIFDLLLPRLLADDLVSAAELAALGEGGLCLNCQPCRFPACGFGK